MRTGRTKTYHCYPSQTHRRSFASSCRRRTRACPRARCSCSRRRIGARLFDNERKHVVSGAVLGSSLVLSIECTRQHLPLYTTPELSFTVTGAPMISLRKPDGSRASFAAGAAVAPLGAGADIFEGFCCCLDMFDRLSPR